jgi:hypothetical protein
MNLGESFMYGEKQEIALLWPWFLELRILTRSQDFWKICGPLE